MDLIPAEEVWAALDDAIAIAHEFDGSPLAEKLAAFGLDAAVVAEIVTARWEQAKAEGRTDAVAFAQGFAEGLITGRTLEVRA
jgi:hypothetical protein